MKSTRRHELQTNVLADSLGHGMEHVQPYVMPVLIGLAVLLAVGLGWSWFSQNQQANRAATWERYLSASMSGDAKKLQDVSAEFGVRPAGLWAKQLAAADKLSQGLNELFADPEAASKSLTEAKDAFEELVDQSKSIPMLNHRALLSCGRAFEGLAAAEKDPQRQADYAQNAAARYKMVVAATGPDTALGEVANKSLSRIKRLSGETVDEGGETAEATFMSWLAQQDFSPPPPPRSPGDSQGPGGAGPGLPSINPLGDSGTGPGIVPDPDAKLVPDAGGESKSNESSELKFPGDPLKSLDEPPATPPAAPPAEPPAESGPESGAQKGPASDGQQP